VPESFTFDAGFTLTPGTETPLFHGDFDETELGGTTGMDVVKLARLAINGIVKDVLEIRPGLKDPQTVESGCSGLRLNMLARSSAASLNRMWAAAKA
jgi:uncharacterized oxidoreductase